MRFFRGMRHLKLITLLVFLGPVLQIILGIMLWDASDMVGTWACNSCGAQVTVGYSPMDKYQLLHEDPYLFPPKFPCHCHAGGGPVKGGMESIICGSVGRWPSLGLFISYWCTLLLPVVVVFLLLKHLLSTRKQSRS